MSSSTVHIVVPGALAQRTGGYIYDARMVAGLRALRWGVQVHELEGVFPRADEVARQSLTQVLSDLPSRSRVVIDGLALGGLPGPARAHSRRLSILGLVHHPLVDETGVDPSQRDRIVALEREALSACAGVLVTSRSTASRLEQYGVPFGRVRVVLPGTDRARRAAGPGAARDPRLLCVATIIPRKGQDVLVRALARLRDRSWSCMCVGSLSRDPDYVTSVRAQVHQLGLEDRIEFPGECGSHALDELYHASSVFVLPSHFEGYGMALSEALARGLPIVSTTGGAIPDTVPEEAGLLVAPGDAAALAGAIDALINDSARRARLASAAYRHAATLPDWGQAAVAFAEAIRCLAPEVETVCGPV